MAMTEFKKGAVICGAGKPMEQIMLITGGKVTAALNGRRFIYEQGDMIGICDLNLGIYSSNYTAVTDVTIFMYPYRNLSAMEGLLREKPDIASLIVTSMCRQLAGVLQYKIALKNEADRAYESIGEIYAQYEYYCKQYAFVSKKHSGVSEVAHFSEIDLLDEWVYAYYMEIKELPLTARRDFFSKPGIALGFLRKSAEDALNAINACGDYVRYLEDISHIYLDSEGNDLFAFVSELHLSSVNIKGADAAVEKLIARLNKVLSGMTGLNPADYQKRFNEYNKNLAAQRENKTETAADETAGTKRNLTDSINVILEYSGLETESGSKFVRNVQEFTKLTDRGSSDEVAYRLRKELTLYFYQLYQSVFVKSLNDPNPSTIIKMFLNFGYVDAALAGNDNADYLYSIADTLSGDPDLGVYTAREWLTLIYKGKKEPCRNDLGEDYPAYLRALKAARKIDDEGEKRLMADQKEKLKFEIENVFPVANKITYGVISTFCPLFADHNVQRKLDVSLINPASIQKTLDEIRGLDFSAYYREVVYANPDVGVSKETIHEEILPDIILTPNVGIRGIMWQEIEGMKRNTPSRMFMPLFLQSDLKTLMIRLTSEFRWEMCKRIQGVHWNELSSPSLTSEFCDYLQFYRNNRDIASEVKESIKTELTRARNNYKLVFSLNYVDWMTYEASGSLRLNKFARKILFAYCPFSAEVREGLQVRPQFSDFVKLYNMKQQQRTLLLTRIFTKITQSGWKVPKELEEEFEYASK